MSRVPYPVLLLLALLPSLWLAWNNRDMAYFGHHHDDATYLVSAKSLAEGNGYRIASLPGAPYSTKFPPAYPLYLSLIWRINPNFPENLTLVLALNWILLPVLILACRWVYPEIPRLWLLLGISPVVVFLSLSAMTEVMSLCLLLLAVGLARGNRTRDALLAGLAAAAGFLVKNALLMLLPAAVVWYAWQRRWRHAAAFTLAMLPAVVAWQLWSSRNATLGGFDILIHTQYVRLYLQTVQLAELPTIISHNIGMLVLAIGALFTFEPEPGLAALGRSTVLAMAAIAGLARLARQQGPSLYLLFAVFYSAQLLVWNFSPNERFLFPLLPLLLTGLVATCRHVYATYLASKAKDPVASRVILALGVLLLATAAVRDLTGVFHYVPLSMAQDRARLAELREIWGWVRDHTPANARINMLSDDPLSYLYTQRQAIARQVPTRYVYTGERDKVLAHFSQLPEIPVEYVVAGPTLCTHNLSPAERVEITARLARRPDLRVVHEWKDWKVMRVERRAAEATLRSASEARPSL
jgi:hypothetical protein